MKYSRACVIMSFTGLILFILSIIFGLDIAYLSSLCFIIGGVISVIAIFSKEK